MTAPALSARTAAFTATGQAVAKAGLVVIALANTAIVTRALGVDVYADWGTVLTIAAMLGFALDPGFAPIVVGRIARADPDVPSLRGLLATRLALAAAVYLAVVVGALLVRGTGAFVLALVLGAELFPRAVTLNAGTFLQAYHLLHRQALLEVACMAVGLAVLAGAAALDAPAGVLAAVGVLLPSVLLASVTQRQLRALPHGMRHGRADRAVIRALLREVAPLTAAILLVSLYTRIDVVFVSAAEDAAGLAQYVLSFRFVEQLIVVAGILAATLLPMLARRSADRSLFEDGTTHDALVAMGALGALASSALVLVAPTLIDVVAGAQFDPAAGLLILLSPMGVALFLNFFLGYLLMALRQGSRYLVLNAIALVVNVALNAALTLRYGNVAAARITWFTELCVVAMAIAPFATAGGAARRAVAKCAVLSGVCIVASEVAFAGAPAGVTGAAAGAATLLVAGPELWRCARAVTGAPASASP